MEIQLNDKVSVSLSDALPNMNPLLVDCVLQNCFKYLSVATISNCRLVSIFWNQTACSALRLRSCVKFKFAEEIYGFIKLMESCEDCPFRKFLFNIFDHELEHPLVQSLFEKFGEEMTSITFELQGNSRYAYNPPRPQVLRHLLLYPEHLEELKLFGLPDNILRAKNLFDPSATNFMDLRSFSVSISQDVWSRAEDDNDSTLNSVKSTRALIFNILDCAKNLKNLHVGTVKCLSQIFQSVNLSLQNLEQFITIPAKASAVKAEEIFLLGETCRNLKVLTLFVDPITVSTSVIYEMLSKMKSLKYLCIRGGPPTLDFPLIKSLNEISTRQAKFSLNQFTVNLSQVRSAQISAHLIDCSLGAVKFDAHKGDVVPEGQMSNLTSLHVCHDTDINDLSYTCFLNNIQLKFPFISKLKTVVNSGDQIQQIYSLIQLRDLHIEDGSNISDKDITGISYCDLFHWCEKTSQKSEAELRLSRKNSYIGNLKRLQYLYLGSEKITNASIIFGLVDALELTSVSLKEPQYRMNVDGQDLKLKKNSHAFQLSMLAFTLPRLTRIELIETSGVGLSHRSTTSVGINAQEVLAVRKCRPHFQLVFVTSTPTGQKWNYC